MKQINIVFLILLFFSTSILSSQELEFDTKEEHELIYSNESKIKPHIKDLVNSLSDGSTVKIEGEKIQTTSVLKEFYKLNKYQPAWTDYDAWLDAFRALESSFEEGLLPDDYHMDGMKEIIEKVESFNDADDFDFEWVAKFDILMTDAVLLYAYHLLEGKVDPYKLDVNWNYGYTDLPGGDGNKLAAAIQNKSVSKELYKLRPQIPAYGMLMDELELYRSIAEKGGWGIVDADGKIDPGGKDSRIPAIRKRLKVTGNLSDISIMESETYDPSLANDIKVYQELHGLDSDGIIGKGTFSALNIPVQQKIDQLRVNLERERWVAHNIPNYFIIVNIATFKTYVIKNDKIIHETNVQVGTSYHQSPVFKSKLKYIEFNPTWTVPRSITVNELVPKLMKNHNYLQEKNMVLLDGSGKIVPSSVDFDKISPKNFPYVMRQQPGPDNALGQLKFIFPNSHSVYLHDTPSKYLFEKASRSFSHGCIRTQNPVKLAEVLLEGTDWTPQKIQETLDSKETTRAYFDEPIDVLLLYWTAGRFEQGESIFYFPDIYKRDAPILEKLDMEVEGTAFDKIKKN